MHPGQSFQSIGIISRPRRSNLAVVVPPLLKWLEARGIQTFIDEETASSLLEGLKGQSRQRVADASQLLLVLGGDGTMLAAARLAAPRGIPILPINMGSLGFLTSFTLEELHPALDDALEGRFSLSERVMISVELVRASKVIDSQRVLNEVVINKGALARMIELELAIGGEFVCRYRADGLIVSTPTGSTAYSMAAGGPIMHPNLQALILNPICPYTLSHRPLVLPDTAHIQVILQTSDEDVRVTLDGQVGVQLHYGDVVDIQQAARPMQLIRTLKKDEYFHILRTKLKWGEAVRLPRDTAC